MKKTLIQRQEACINRMLESRTDAELLAIAARKGVTADECARYAKGYRLRANAARGLESRTFGKMAAECERMARLLAPADLTTVYPSRAGGFPPASFLTFADALEYIRTLNRYGLACGICTCPAASFAMHYHDTL